MTAALAWVNDLVQWLGRWVPRLVLVAPTHRGVRFGPRGQALAKGPGLVWYWPMIHELIEVPVTLQSIQLCGIQLPITDTGGLLPRVAIATLNIQFQVRDAVKASVRVLNFHALVGNRAQAIAVALWPGFDGDRNAWLAASHVALANELESKGIEVVALDIAGVGIGVAVKNISDWSYADNVHGAREKP